MSENENACRNVQKTCFALIDAGLFLDTHPDNASALAYFNKIKPEAAQAAETYEKNFGPLTKDSVNRSDWAWCKGPWPWEGVK